MRKIKILPVDCQALRLNGKPFAGYVFVEPSSFARFYGYSRTPVELNHQYEGIVADFVAEQVFCAANVSKRIIQALRDPFEIVFSEGFAEREWPFIDYVNQRCPNIKLIYPRLNLQTLPYQLAEIAGGSNLPVAGCLQKDIEEYLNQVLLGYFHLPLTGIGVDDLRRTYA
jgi:hypothetical protein